MSKDPQSLNAAANTALLALREADKLLRCGELSLRVVRNVQEAIRRLEAATEKPETELRWPGSEVGRQAIQALIERSHLLTDLQWTRIRWAVEETVTTWIVTGSRTWVDEPTMVTALEHLPLGSRVVHGGAGGADAMADRLARSRGLEVVSYPVDNTIDGQWPAAGPRRNRRMIDAELARLPSGERGRVRGIYFNSPPGELSSGTADAVRHMVRRGIEVEGWDAIR